MAGPWDWAQGGQAFPNMGVGMSPRRYIRPVTPLPLGYAPGPAVPPPMAGAPVDLSTGRPGDVAAGAGGLLATLSPVGDIRDAWDGSGRLMQGLLGGRWQDVASGAAGLAGGLLGIGVPGHYSQYKEATEAAVDATRRAAGDTGADVARRASDDAPLPRPAASPAPPPSPRDIVDTRGRGERFHGTSSPIDNLGDYYGNDASIYGTGFYTTDAADVGVGYMGKGRGGQPSLYRVHTADDVPLYDLDAPLTDDVRAMAASAFGRESEWAASELGRAKTLREFLDEARGSSALEDVGRPQMQEYFDAIRANLEDAGYRGYRHRGGSNTGTAAHDVRLYWTPSRDVRLELTSPDLYRQATDPFTSSWEAFMSRPPLGGP